MTAAYTPKRGDIAWITFDPVRGHELAGHRPVIVVSGKDFNEKTGHSIVVPITSKRKGYAIEVPVVAGDIDGVALTASVRALDWRKRKARYAGECPETALRAIQGMLFAFITDGKN